MGPVYFREKNIRGVQPTPAQLIAIFWPGDTSPQNFFGNQLMVRRAEGLKLLTEADFGTLLNCTLEFLQLLKSYNSRTITEGFPDDLLACKILDTRTELRDLRISYKANLAAAEQAFAADGVENIGNPIFYTFKNARTRLWLPNGQVIRLSNNILAKLPSGGNAVLRCRRALGFEIQEGKLLAVQDDQSKLDVTNLNAFWFVLNRPFLATGEPTLSFIKALAKALYVSKVFPNLTDRFLVNIEGLLLSVKDYISVFDTSTLFEILGVNTDCLLDLKEVIGLEEPYTSQGVVLENAGVSRKVKISFDPAQSIYAAEDLDFVNKQWVAAVSYLVLYSIPDQGYSRDCEIEISYGNYYTILHPSF